VQEVPPDEVKQLAHESDGPEEIEPGIWRIPLPLPFALRWANVYLIVGDGPQSEHVLVDAGLGLPDDDAALRAGLERAGASMDRITTLVLTHNHPDHIGLSGTIHAASGAPMRLLASEADDLYKIWGDSAGAAHAATRVMYAAHGMPADELERSRVVSRAIARTIGLPPREAVIPLEDGETLRLAGANYRVIWTPGHSDHHLCMLRDDGLFIAGDHILPRITPNIGLYPEARANPLRDYRESLARVRDLPVRLVLPGHGHPFTDLAGRVDELREHHEERAEQTMAALAAHPGGADAYTLAADLFGERLRGPDDHRFALVETLAHLEALRADGRVERDERDGCITYVALATSLSLAIEPGRDSAKRVASD